MKNTTLVNTDSAFPLLTQNGNNIFGLTKREYVAAMVLQGLASKYTMNNPSDQITITRMAVELSDELLNQLEQ